MAQHFPSYGELKGTEKGASCKYFFTIVHSDVIPNREQMSSRTKCALYTQWDSKRRCALQHG